MFPYEPLLWIKLCHEGGGLGMKLPYSCYFHFMTSALYDLSFTRKAEVKSSDKFSE